MYLTDLLLQSFSDGGPPCRVMRPKMEVCPWCANCSPLMMSQCKGHQEPGDYCFANFGLRTSSHPHPCHHGFAKPSLDCVLGSHPAVSPSFLHPCPGCTVIWRLSCPTCFPPYFLSHRSSPNTNVCHSTCTWRSHCHTGDTARYSGSSDSGWGHLGQ